MICPSVSNQNRRDAAASARQPQPVSDEFGLLSFSKQLSAYAELAKGDRNGTQ
jgi:hypothetical protein